MSGFALLWLCVGLITFLWHMVDEGILYPDQENIYDNTILDKIFALVIYFCIVWIWPLVWIFTLVVGE